MTLKMLLCSINIWTKILQYISGLHITKCCCHQKSQKIIFPKAFGLEQLTSWCLISHLKLNWNIYFWHQLEFQRELGVKVGSRAWVVLSFGPPRRCRCYYYFPHVLKSSLNLIWKLIEIHSDAHLWTYFDDSFASFRRKISWPILFEKV